MADFPNLAIEELERRIKLAGSQKAVADDLDIPQSQLSEVLSGRRDLSERILEKIGFDKVVIHVSKQDTDRLLRSVETTITTMRGAKRLERAYKQQAHQVAKS
jgi:hypothetical protein